MLIGTAVMSIFRTWITIVWSVIVHPILVIQVLFLWFTMALASSYLFFLVVHKEDVTLIAKTLVLQLVYSCVLAFSLATALVAFYEFVLHNVLASKFFAIHGHLFYDLTLQQSPELLQKRVCFVTILLCGFFAAHYVGIMLDEWYDHKISNRYGWWITCITLICWGFLWMIRYVV